MVLIYQDKNSGGVIVSNKKFIVANWKMNKTVSEAEEFLKRFIALNKNKDIDVAICPPFLCLEKALKICKESKIKIGAQNCHFEKSGAFTGEISANMLASIGVEYVILGHSERRNYFYETDKIVNKKVKTVLENKLKPIICVGETLSEREKGKEKEKIKTQIGLTFKDIPPEKISEIVVAYEPIWAIGTGKTVSIEECKEMVVFIKNYLAFEYGLKESRSIRLLYGGSMNEKNAKELLSVPNVDGGLIGGASLNPFKFTDIINQAESVAQ